jgi:hypothetical protein
MQTLRRLGTLLKTGTAMIRAAIRYCLLLIGYCLLLIAGGIWILTPVALFFTWPLLAWSWWYDTDSIFTPGGWITEHVWLGVLAAVFVLVALATMRDQEVGLGGLVAALFLSWPVLAWAVGSDYTGYALGRAGQIAEWIWLGVIAACIAGVIIIAAVLGVIALVRR